MDYTNFLSWNVGRLVPNVGSGIKNTIEAIGVGASKFSGVRRIFARISLNLPEKLFCDFYLQMFSHKDHEVIFLCDLQKKVFVCFSQTLGAIFWSQTTLGAIFVRIFRDFA